MSQPKRWKSLEFDYDFVTSQPSEEFPVCLSWQERQILLSLIDSISWATRWNGDNVDQAVIDNYREQLSVKLLGECDVDCDDVWACILPDGESIPDDLLEWLRDKIKNDEGVRDDINNPEPGIHPDVNTVITTGCDKDNLYGFCKQLVQFMHKLVNEAFEKYEVITNFIELFQALADEIPLLTEVLDYIEFLNDSLAENYVANYDAALEQEYICEVFCLAIAKGSPCELTWWDIYVHFMTRFGMSLEGKDFGDILQYMATGSWNGDEFCDLGLATLANVFYWGGHWFGMDLPMAQRLWTSFLNDPDTDWSTLCDTCTWERDYPIDEDNLDGWSVIQGQWATTTGVYSTRINPNNRVVIEKSYTAFDGLKSIVIERGWDLEALTGNQTIVRVTHTGGTDTQQAALSGGALKDKLYTYTTALDGVTKIEIEVRHNTINEGGSVSVRSITVAGEGDNPPPLVEDEEE